MKRSGLLAAAACLLSAQQPDEVRISAHLYTPPALHLSAQTNLVPLEVVVRDGRGQAVAGLQRGDFEVLDEGKPRDIAAFSVESRAALQAAGSTEAVTKTAASPVAATPIQPAPAPPRRSTLLFFDDLHGTAAELQRTKAAARRFLKEGMAPGARAGVFAASAGLTLDFTDDADALTAAVEKVHGHQKFSENGLMPCPRITPYQAFLIDNNISVDALTAAVKEAAECGNAAPTRPSSRRTTMGLSTDPATADVRAQAAATWQQARNESLNEFDAVENAMGVLAKASGTRVLLLVSTGFLSGLMDRERTEAIDHAIHAGIVINALDAKGLWSEPPGRPFDQPLQTARGLPHETFTFETETIGSRNDAMNEAMEEFAAGTGGLFFHNSNDLVGGFAELGAVPQTAYLLAIRPDTDASGKYHKLRVRLAGKNGEYVQTRPGYFAPSNSAPVDTASALRPLDLALTSSDSPAAIPIDVTVRSGKTEKGDATVSTLIHVDLNGLTFAQRDDRHVQKLTFIGALLDGSGKMVVAKEGAMDLVLKDATWARLKASGVNAGLTFAAPSGPYSVRVVVQDADGKLAAQNRAGEASK